MKSVFFILLLMFTVSCQTSGELHAKSDFKPHHSEPSSSTERWEDLDLSGNGLLEDHIDTEYLEACDVAQKERVDYPRAYFTNTPSTCIFSAH